MEEKIRVVLCVPGYEARTVDIANTPAAWRNVVDGPIEVYRPFADPYDERTRNVAIICNARGRLDEHPPCRLVRSDHGGSADVIRGIFFICYAPYGDRELMSLPDDLANGLKNRFRMAEFYERGGKEICAIPYAPPYDDEPEVLEVIRDDILHLE